MSLLEALILGVVQGITEFLPISSSGHLVLAEGWLGLEVEELADFDIVVHLGTLLAILVYFRADILSLLKTFFRFDFKSEEGRLIGRLLIGTLPIVIVGFLWGDLIMQIFRNQLYVGILMLLVACYFLFAENFAAKRKRVENMKWWQGLLVGCAQCLALLPGVSRSGSTIATAMIMGLDRVKAARFSFLLGSIAITGAGVLLGADVVENGFTLDVLVLGAGFLASIVSSYLAVSFLMKFLKNNKLNVFAYYLFAIGAVAIVISL